MKLFVSIYLPDEVKKEILILQEKIKNLNLLTGSFTDFDKLHLTLNFIGKTDEKDVVKIIERLREINFHKFSVSLNTIGFFLIDDYPRILWLNLTDSNNNLFELHNKVQKSLDSIINKENEKDFINHITIARIQTLKNKELFFKQIYQLDFKKIEFQINRFTLNESTELNNKNVYVDLEHFQLY